jgi:5-formyltetrahydrofolate cyclo-ligase|tara:strand:+ start:59 stop:382 length:324 start_codon:yes stop_codon:yes gene_type:complete
MNSILEKEKKLNLALTKLKNLNLENPDIKKNIQVLGGQKNQLEIEKNEIEKKYKTLVDEHDNLTKKLEDLQNKEKIEEKKRLEFSEKIDELNQETNTLMDEIDKWQT